MTEESAGQPEAMKRRHDASRTRFEIITDALGHRVGSFAPWLALLNVMLVTAWVVINRGSFGDSVVFDPYPYPMLELLGTLEAILISTLVLGAQHRAARRGELRDEMDLHVNLVSERELTKLLDLVVRIARKAGVEVGEDAELARLLAPTNVEAVEASLASQLHPSAESLADAEDQRPEP